MAVKELFKIKRVTSGNLELEAVAEALQIKDISIISPAAMTDYVKVQIEKTYMNVIPVHLLLPHIYGGKHKSLFDYLREKIPEIPNYKVLNGEKFTIEPSGSYSYLEAIYSEHTPDEFGAGEPGTRTSDTKLFCMTMYNSSEISSTGWVQPDARLEPEITPSFPHFDRIPANREVLLAGIAAYTTSNGSTKPVYLRIWDEEKVLFDDDRYGFLIDPTVFNELNAYDQITTAGGTGYAVNFFRFDEPLVLGPQRKYTFEVYVEYDGTNALPVKGFMITLLGLIRPPAR